MKKQEMGSVFKKLYFMLIVIILIIYICTITIFLTYAAARRSDALNNMQAMVRQGALALEAQLDSVSNLEKNLISDSRTSDFSQGIYQNDYERTRLALGLISSMHSFQSMNSIVKEIEILFPRQEVVLSTVSELSRDVSIPAQRVEGDTARRLVYAEGQVQMELWYPLTHPLEENYIPDYGVRVTLSEEYLQEILNLFATQDQSGGFSVFDTGKELLRIPSAQDGELLESWRQAWEKAGCPDSFLGNGGGRTERYLFVSEKLPGYGTTLVAYRNGRWIDSSTITALLVMGGVLLLVGGLFFLMLYQTNVIVNKPLQKVVQAFEAVQEGNLNVRITHRYKDEFQYIYSAFNRTVERIQELIENVKEQGRLLQNAELIQLQSQINPHFLYNSFYLIRIMAKNESYEQITGFVTSLAKYYRFLNKEVDQNIPLEREAEHMMNYIDIQQMRFGDKVSVKVGQLPEEAAAFRVPKLILQPVVENAYNYGMADILQDGQITVSYQIQDSFICVAVEDNGSGAEEEHLTQMRAYIRDYQGRAAGHALSNIDRRLKLAFGEDSGILLEKSALGGLKVVLKLDRSVAL